MMINFDLPIQTIPKYAHLPPEVVSILSTQGRNAEYPVMGYVGHETNLTYWTPEGKPMAAYDLPIGNVPHTVVTWIVVSKTGTVHNYSDDVYQGLKPLESETVLSVRKVVSVFPVGIRDDHDELDEDHQRQDGGILESIVKEFTGLSGGSMGGDIPSDYDKKE